jgi:hypothetical protein
MSEFDSILPITTSPVVAFTNFRAYQFGVTICEIINLGSSQDVETTVQLFNYPYQFWLFN